MDGTRWALAKHFVLQGAQLRLVLSTHPRLHFPNDTVLAVTRSALRPDHPLRALLAPHGRYTLGLHEGVIHHRRSVLHNSQRELYAAFPYTTEGQHRLFAAGHHGVPGRGDWAAYRFSDGLFGDHVPYGRFRRDWFELLARYADHALASVAPDDDAVRAWAGHVAAWIPGFPDGTAIGRPGVLVHTVASYLAAVSVYHSGDHHSYSAIPLCDMPWRLRAPPPSDADPGPYDPQALVTPEDRFRHHLCHVMFFAPQVVCSLRDVIPASHHAAMERLDARWAGSGFPSSGEIAASLQY